MNPPSSNPRPRQPPAKRIGRGVARLVRLSVTRPLAVLLAVLLLALLGGWLAVTRLGIDTSTEEMLSPELPFRQATVALERSFPMLEETLVVVVQGPDRASSRRAAERLAAWMEAEGAYFDSVFYPEGDPFLRRQGLLYLEETALADLIDRLAAAQGFLATLAADPSLRGLAEVLVPALGSGESLPAADLEAALARMADTAGAIAAGQPALLSWQAALTPELAADGPPFQLILATPSLDYASLNPARAAMAAVAAGAAQLGLAAEGVRVGMTGKPAMKADELQSIKGNIAGIGLLSFGLVGLLLWRGLGSWRGTLAILLLLAAGLGITAGFATLAVGRLNLISVAFAVLFIGLSVDYGLHYVLRAAEACWGRRGPTAAAAGLQLAAREQGAALLLCAATSIAAFFAFLPTSYRGLAELGLISGVGIAVALLLTFTLVPALLAATGWQGLAHRQGGLAAAGERLLLRRRTAVLALLALLAAGAALLVPRVGFDDDPLSLRDPASPSVATLTQVLSDPRAVPYRAEVLEPSLAAAEALAERLEALPEVKRALTVRDLVPGGQQEKLALIEDARFLLAPLLYPPPAAAPPDEAARRAAAERLAAALHGAPEPLRAPSDRLAAALEAVIDDPERLAAMETALVGDLPDLVEELTLSLQAEPFGVAELPASLAGRYLAPDGAARIEVRPVEDLRDREARRRFVAAVQGVAPAAAGDAVVMTEAGDAVIGSFLEAAAYAFVAVALLVLLVLRRPLDLLLAFAPVVLAGLLTVAVAVLLGIQLNFANVIVLPLLVGLGIDSALHLVVRRREAPDRPLLENSTPRAILFSSLTTLASFGALALSDHPGTASMGLLLLVALVAVLVSVFLLLPALLRPGSRDPATPPTEV